MDTVDVLMKDGSTAGMVVISSAISWLLHTRVPFPSIYTVNSIYSVYSTKKKGQKFLGKVSSIEAIQLAV